MCAQKPLLISLKDIRKSPPTGTIFSFDKEAEDAYDSINDTFRKIVVQANNFDSFLSAMFGKAATHLLRLCGILHVFQESIMFLKNNQILECNKKDLTNEFVENVDSVLKNKVVDITIISSKTVLQAHELLIYFNKNRMVLAKYDIE
ncbi:hypothetical protein BpHYR1_047778 [Brachionus plicatilis]|uniref:Uncharacterized protein n=1 Tax=Brachionus plicatilis TaxID=10195 RepID=A0A3M7T8P0_BRAPC|nr:hypothetical protein BpHYR1_047778 [Brachionus plicatilis]